LLVAARKASLRMVSTPGRFSSGEVLEDVAPFVHLAPLDEGPLAEHVEDVAPQGLLLDLIDLKGQEVAAALAALRALG